MDELRYKKDFDIETKKMDVEFFVWKCPNCGTSNRCMEFYVQNNELFCAGCHETSKYIWESN